MSGPTLVLVGPPGAGKTTVGHVVAERLDVGFRDTDYDIEATAGKPIPEIFYDDGEETFRKLERDAVSRALTEHGGVLALGGGAVLAEETRQALAGRPVVFLDVHLTDAVKRVGMARNRPVLALNPRAELGRLLDARRPYYEQVARGVVGTDDREPAEVANEVLAVLERDSG